MRSSRIWVLTAILLAGVVAAAWFGSAAQAREDESLIWRMAIEAKLERSISCEFEDVPLRDAADFIRRAADINIVIDPAVLAESERLITLKVKDVTAKSMLNMIMTMTGLDYVLKHQALYISTPARVRKVAPQHLRIYDVRDLLVTYEALGGAGDTEGGNGDGQESDDRVSAAEQGGAELIALIVTLTGPENWRQVLVLTGERGGADEEGRSTGAAGTSF